MNLEKLKKFCILPKWKIEVERKINPDKSGHIIYWEWITLDGKRSIVVPHNKLGKWQLFVDVISPDKSQKSYDTEESETAYNKLMEAAKAQGFAESGEVQSEICEINLQNGKLTFSVSRFFTDDGFVPQLKIDYTDNDGFIKTSHEINLNSVKDLSALSEMFASAVNLKGEQK
jgi:hypothetical protein